MQRSPGEVSNLSNGPEFTHTGNLLPSPSLSPGATTPQRSCLIGCLAPLKGHQEGSGEVLARPRINSNKANELQAGGIVSLAYNFLTGTYFDQWDDYLYQDAGR